VDSQCDGENCGVRAKQSGEKPSPDRLQVAEPAFDAGEAMIQAGQLAFDHSKAMILAGELAFDGTKAPVDGIQPGFDFFLNAHFLPIGVTAVRRGIRLKHRVFDLSQTIVGAGVMAMNCLQLLHDGLDGAFVPNRHGGQHVDGVPQARELLQDALSLVSEKFQAWFSHSSIMGAAAAEVKAFLSCFT
jgi:hypothetical protein